jgi:hypothetical protein
VIHLPGLPSGSAELELGYETVPGAADDGVVTFETVPLIRFSRDHGDDVDAVSFRSGSITSFLGKMGDAVSSVSAASLASSSNRGSVSEMTFGDQSVRITYQSFPRRRLPR